ncbi:ABC-2 type transport system ATP-binding protein [Nocardiopsis mwathae]|uniref:ABC-2 type transport system ATP-binding protein n=1 Tax=Nocardiopsis mwathae TaxID=1472723 RepID=A0A7W9YMR7_9ACTN|nr:ATP-binding cassette domain-containing protein [Nocardiopsis mwathae]MBB6174907.1 ABC-2 type transport system ATP-binding protein [Nocardiopsis mwathae]
MNVVKPSFPTTSGGKPPAVEVERLVKAFGRERAVDSLDLTIPAGGVFGILGPNGAGKTTTIRILATLLRPDSGSARIFGHDVVRDADAVRSRISLTGQFASVDEELSGRENLVLMARLHGHPWNQARDRADELLSAFGLTEAAERQAKTYSGGMRRRLDIAASIITVPDLLFLDEPTTGLDPRSRNQLWDIVRMLVDIGTTVLLTTQYLDEADQLADRIAVIDRGSVIAEGTPSDLKASVGTGSLHVYLQDPEQRPDAERLLTAELGIRAYSSADPASLSAGIADPRLATQALGLLSRAGIGVRNFALDQPSLDEVFLSLTGRVAGTPEDKKEAGVR